MFWDRANPANGLMPDRWPSPSFSSIAATGFALTAYPVAVEHGWITRAQARERTLATLRFFWTAPQGPQGEGVSGYKGFFYHFLDMQTGLRFRRCELSSIDTTLLLGGILFAGCYFDQPGEAEIRDLAQRMGEVADHAQGLLTAARDADFEDVARQAESLRQQLLAARNKVQLLHGSLATN